MNTDVRMGLRLFCVADTLAQEEEQMATYSPAPVRQGPKLNITHMSNKLVEAKRSI